MVQAGCIAGRAPTGRTGPPGFHHRLVSHRGRVSALRAQGRAADPERGSRWNAASVKAGAPGMAIAFRARLCGGRPSRSRGLISATESGRGGFSSPRSLPIRLSRPLTLQLFPDGGTLGSPFRRIGVQRVRRVVDRPPRDPGTASPQLYPQFLSRKITKPAPRIGAAGPIQRRACRVRTIRRWDRTNSTCAVLSVFWYFPRRGPVIGERRNAELR